MGTTHFSFSKLESRPNLFLTLSPTLSLSLLLKPPSHLFHEISQCPNFPAFEIAHVTPLSDNVNGQLGTQKSHLEFKPVSALADVNIVQIACGSNYTVALSGPLSPRKLTQVGSPNTNPPELSPHSSP